MGIEERLQIAQTGGVLFRFLLADPTLEHRRRPRAHFGDENGAPRHTTDFADHAASYLIVWKVEEESEAKGAVEVVIGEVERFEILFQRRGLQSDPNNLLLCDGKRSI